MCSITEPRRATVSCKHLFSSTINDRSTPASSSRRHHFNNSNTKRSTNSNNNNNNNNNNIHPLTRPSSHSTKQLQRTSDTNVFHVPFSLEQTIDNGNKISTITNSKLPRTRLNPLSPAFFSARHISLISEQKPDVMSSDMKIPSLSETSDYGSGTDLEFQSIQHFSPQPTSSQFVFDFETTINNFSQPRRISLSSSSSFSSASTSPSSSISNLSSLSSSPELPAKCLSNKKPLITTNNNNNDNNHMNTLNESSSCQCEKQNLSNRKRNRLNSYPVRRFQTVNVCESCQIKRNKCNYRSKYLSNRSSKQRSNHRSHDSTSSSIKFSVDLTGLSIIYTVEYHDNINYTCPSNYITYCNSLQNRCKCSSTNDWTLHLSMNSINDYNHDWYYYDTNNNSWFTPMIDSSLYNYNDYYLVKTDHSKMNNTSTIYFDEQTIYESNEHSPTYYLRSMTLEIEFESNQSPPTRSWLHLASANHSQPAGIFTVMNYNILCDKYASRQVYGYCPSWALKWEYRGKQILDELCSYAADIIALQEIETDQYHFYFLPELKKLGYDGVFSPKSRAKTMCEQDRRFVDGCAIFYRQSKFRLIKDYLVEFNQLAISAANGLQCHDMMNRVMTKDNIGLVALLETKEEIYSHAYPTGAIPSNHKQMLFVCTAHIHWDPEYCDVKVVQTLMLLSELKTIMEDAMQKHRTNSYAPMDCASVPLVLCGDFNSLPNSGVIEFMRNGKISSNHADFKDLRYESYLQKISGANINPTENTDIVHHFKLESAYETKSSPIMPYTNYTYDFKGIIDYVFFSSKLMRVLGVLGPLDPEWLQSNKIVGCPHPNVPSDHFSLLVEFELNPTTYDLPVTMNSDSKD